MSKRHLVQETINIAIANSIYLGSIEYTKVRFLVLLLRLSIHFNGQFIDGHYSPSYVRAVIISFSVILVRGSLLDEPLFVFGSTFLIMQFTY